MLQWPSLLNAEEPEEVIKLVAEDDSNCITLHRKVVPQNESTEVLIFHFALLIHSIGHHSVNIFLTWEVFYFAAL